MNEPIVLQIGTSGTW